MTRPPDKKKHEAALSEIVQKIEATQQEMRSVAPKADDSTTKLLRSLRADKESTIARRKNIDSELTAVNQEMVKKNNELTKVQSKLQGYRNDSRIDEAIKKLEYQLRMNNFSLSEERKIVSEIDSLKRSKKVLCVVNGLKKELEALKESRNRIRAGREDCFKKVTEIKQREDNIKRKVNSDKLRHEELKKELDALYEQKRTKVSQFKAQEKEFYKFRGSLRFKQRQEQKLKKEEERLAFEQDLADYEASREPYETQKQNCKTLTTYLQAFLDKNDSQEAESAEQGSSGHDSDTLAQSLESEGLYMLKKKDEDLFSGTNKPKARRSRKDKKRVVQNKPITHSREALIQFAELQIKAPATVQDVPEAILKVESIKSYYDSLPLLSLDAMNHAVGGLPYGGGSAGAPSLAESAITESTPTTPEVQADDPFLRGESSPWRMHRKLSLDSGACELETECDEQKTPEVAPEGHPLMGATVSDASLGEGKMAGDFPWRSDVSRRTLSTVSSQSDKDSSASSDTVVESPHSVDSPQNKSCDDLKTPSVADFFNPSCDSSADVADSNVEFDWFKIVSAQKNRENMSDGNTDGSEATASDNSKLLPGSLKDLRLNSNVQNHTSANLEIMSTDALRLAADPDTVVSKIEQLAENVLGVGNEALVPEQGTSKDGVSTYLGQPEISMQIRTDSQSNESFQMSSNFDQSQDSKSESQGEGQ